MAQERRLEADRIGTEGSSEEAPLAYQSIAKSELESHIGNERSAYPSRKDPMGM